jgi:hypothetical protein
MNRNRLAAIAALSLAAFVLPAQAAGSGLFTVRNGLSLTITPYFKSNCWGPGMADPKTKDWVDFGNIGPGSQFGWGFTDPMLIDPACKHPRVEFTYGFGHGPDSVPGKHVPRSRLYVFNPNPNDDDDVTIGGVLIGKDDD